MAPTPASTKSNSSTTSTRDKRIPAASEKTSQSRWRKYIPGFRSKYKASKTGDEVISSSPPEFPEDLHFPAEEMGDNVVVPGEKAPENLAVEHVKVNGERIVEKIRTGKDTTNKVTDKPVRISPSDTLAATLNSPPRVLVPPKPIEHNKLAHPTIDRIQEDKVEVVAKPIEFHPPAQAAQSQAANSIAEDTKGGNGEQEHTHEKQVSYDKSNGLLAGAVAGGLVITAFLGVTTLYNWMTQRQERRETTLSTKRKYAVADSQDEVVTNWD